MFVSTLELILENLFYCDQLGIKLRIKTSLGAGVCASVLHCADLAERADIFLRRERKIACADPLPPNGAAARPTA